MLCHFSILCSLLSQCRYYQNLTKIFKNLTQYLTNFTEKSDQNLTIFRPFLLEIWPNYFLANRALCVNESLVHFSKTSTLSVKFLEIIFHRGKKITLVASWKSDLRLKYLTFWAFFGQNLTSFGHFGPKNQIIWPWSD